MDLRSLGIVRKPFFFKKRTKELLHVSRSRAACCYNLCEPRENGQRAAYLGHGGRVGVADYPADLAAPDRNHPVEHGERWRGQTSRRTRQYQNTRPPNLLSSAGQGRTKTSGVSRARSVWIIRARRGLPWSPWAATGTISPRRISLRDRGRQAVGRRGRRARQANRLDRFGGLLRAGRTGGHTLPRSRARSYPVAGAARGEGRPHVTFRSGA